MKHTFCQRNLRLLFLFLVVLGLNSLEAPAAIIVEVQNANVAVNSIGTVDVLVYSDSGDVNIGGFGFAFEIQPAAGNVGLLEFSDPQLANETSTMARTYLFDGGVVDSGSFVTAQTYVDGFLFFSAPGDFSILGAAQQLLIRLDVRHILPGGTDPDLALSDSFEITPVWNDGISDTFDFLDDQGVPLMINHLASSSGTVQITSGSAAVPEPGHLALMFAGVAGAWLRKRRLGLSAATSSVKT